MSNAGDSPERLVTYVDVSIGEAFRLLAREHGRSVAAELRVALLRYIEEETVAYVLEVAE